MKIRDCRGWDEALADARRQRPDADDANWERVGNTEVDWTYGDAPWFSLHPSALVALLAK
jgi:hypothetical protein